MKRKKNGFLHEVKKNRVAFLMLMPTLLFFIINNYFPMIGIYYAFTQFDFKGGLFNSPFIGLKNFDFLFHSGTLFRITLNTILYNVAFIILENVLEILFAIFLSEISSKVFRKVTQSIMFLPHFVSYVILSALVYNVLNYDYGFINTSLNSLGVPPYDFYNTPGVWKYIIVLCYLWKSVGYGMVIYLANLLGISPEYYEAASIDGANIFQRIRYITLPYIKPTFITLFLYSIGGILKGQFDLFYQLVGNNGVLFQATDIIDTYVYRSLMVNFDVGMGTAAGLYQSIFGFVLIMTVNYIVKKKNPEYALF